jgi:hypothetical protein
MTENKSIPCSHCGATQLSEREKEIRMCFQCRRYGLLHGHWPEPNKMSVASSSVSIRITEL